MQAVAPGPAVPVTAGRDRSDVVLSTSGGVTDAGPAVHPYFFIGLLTDPAVAAAGMLACAAVARARYFVPGSVLAPASSAIPRPGSRPPRLARPGA
jgi:hypothetical protein